MQRHRAPSVVTSSIRAPSPFELSSPRELPVMPRHVVASLSCTRDAVTSYLPDVCTQEANLVGAPLCSSSAVGYLGACGREFRSAAARRSGELLYASPVHP